MPKANNNEILAYALRHLEQERDEIQAKIDHIRQQLGVRANASVAAEPVAAAGTGKARRVLSAAARRRIAAAQKRRWAAHRKAKKAADKE
jgi:triosephosphate isomerase